jgi:hypothetical protein
MGIEPTQDALQRPANGFEDRGEHQLSIIPGLAEPYFGCQTLGDRWLAPEQSQLLSDATHTVFEDRGGHQPPNIPSRDWGLE